MTLNRRLIVGVVIIVCGCESETRNDDPQMRRSSLFLSRAIGNIAASKDGGAYYLATKETGDHILEDPNAHGKTEPGTHLRISRIDVTRSTLASSVLSDEGFAPTEPTVVESPDGVVFVGTSTHLTAKRNRPFVCAVWIDAKGTVTRRRHIVGDSSVYAMDGASAPDGSVLVGVSHAGELRVQDPGSPDIFEMFGDKVDSAAYTILRFDSDANVVSHVTWNDKRDLALDSSQMRIRTHEDGSVSALMLFVTEHTRGSADDFEWRLAQIDNTKKVLSVTPIWRTINDVEMEATKDGGVITSLYVEIGASVLNTHGIWRSVDSNFGSDSWSLALVKSAPSGKTEWVTVSGNWSRTIVSADIVVSPDDGSIYLATVFSKSMRIGSTGATKELSMKGPENALALINIDEKGVVRSAEVLCHPINTIEEMQYIPGGKLALVVASRGPIKFDKKIRAKHTGILTLTNDGAARLSASALEIDLMDRKNPWSTPISTSP